MTWSSTDGKLVVYKDNVRAEAESEVKTGYNITGGGAWVLGQDQDERGGGFEVEDAFEGELAQVNIWSRVLTKQEVSIFSKNCESRISGDFKSWQDFKTGLRGNVQTKEHPSCKNCK